MNKRTLVILFVLFDLLSAALSWSCFFIYRKIIVERDIFGPDLPLELGPRFYLGVTIIPLFWITLHYLSGAYQDVYRKSKLRELGRTFLITVTGVVILFFALILDDVIVSYKDYYSSFIILTGLQFILTYIPRLVLTSSITRQIRNNRIGFNTLMIGSNGRAQEIVRELNDRNNSTGNRIVGFLNGNSSGEYLIEEKVKHLGSLADVRQVVEQHRIEEVIITLETTEHQAVSEIITTLSGTNVVIKASPDIHDILTGKVKVQTIFGLPLIEITHALMPVWQQNLKRVMDVSISILLLALLSPLTLFLAIGVKTSSRGPVLLRQERIGKYGKPFTMLKFRSMVADAEKNGPELSRRDDDRITNFGKFMRQRKLDEIPNFINVIKGEMSLVGPRPERQFFIDQIVTKVPHYVHLHKVKPGITSWGQVKYGYAATIDEMLRRLKYDLLYIENMSLFVDLQILGYTILTIFRKENI